MSMDGVKKMLVAIDGSHRSLGTIKTISQMDHLKTVQIDLLHIFSSIPDVYWDLEKEPVFMHSGASMRAWEASQRQSIEKHLDSCRKILIGGGLPPENIRLMIEKRRNGIARDIIEIALTGYDCLVTRRRGFTRLKRIVLGSVAFKLFYHLPSVPLFYAGRLDDNGHILVAFDGSQNSFKALTFLTRAYAATTHHFLLVNVQRPPMVLKSSKLQRSQFNDVTRPSEPQMQSHLMEAADYMVSGGIRRDRIQTQIITDAYSRAGAVADLADKGSFNTIVVGRKGVSQVKDFLAGGVGYKILHQARRHNVIVV